jgi:hypothetical protein
MIRGMTQGFRMAPRRELASDRWNDAVAAFDEAWLWHRAEMIEALAYWPGYTDASFAVLDEAGRVQALVPLHRVAYTRLGGVARLVQYESFGGFAIDRTQGRGLYRKLRDLVVEQLDTLAADGACVDIRLPPMAPAWRGADAPRVNPLMEAGFAALAGQTWAIDLAPAPDEIRRRYSHGARSDLKKASALPGAMRVATAADLDAFHALHVETYRRTGARPVPLDTFRVIFERVMPQGLARILLYESGGRLVAGHTTGIFKNAACYWNGASADDRRGGENRILFDAQIMAAREDSCVVFDAGDAFPGARDSKNKGLSDFKASFGGALMPAWRGRRNNPRLGQRLLRAARQVRLILSERA